MCTSLTLAYSTKHAFKCAHAYPATHSQTHAHKNKLQQSCIIVIIAKRDRKYKQSLLFHNAVVDWTNQHLSNDFVFPRIG